MRFLLIAALLLSITFVTTAQTKIIRKLNDTEMGYLKPLFSDFEAFFKINKNDTVYEHQRNFNMKFTPSRLYNSKIQVWNDRDSARTGFEPIFTYAAFDKKNGEFDYTAKLSFNPLRKPDVIQDELRKVYYFEIPVKQKETWHSIGIRNDTVITERAGFVKYKVDSSQTDSISKDSISIMVDTTIVQVADTIKHELITDKIFIIRTTLTNGAFSGFKVYAITVKGKEPDLEPISEEMQWWLKLDNEWRSFFKEKHKLSAYPENYEIRKCQGLRELDVSGKQITDIGFLSNFILLEKLNLSKTLVKDLSAIQNLTKLKELNLAGSKVDTLLYLRNLTNLEILDVSDLQLYSIADLAALVKIRELSCGGNKLKDLEPLRNMTVLEELDISLNYSIKDVEPITGIVTLEKLKLRKVVIGSLEPLTGLTNLIHLDCFNAGISDLNPIKKLPKLMHLDISHNSISDIGPLRNLRYITYFSMASTKISDLSPLSGFRHLEYLNVSSNPQVKSIGAVPNETLNTLIAHYSGLSTGEIQRFKKKNPKCKITYY
jgi:internalin A